MTSQQEADAALRLYQATKSEDRAVAESILDQFFFFPTAAEYEATLGRLTEALTNERS